MDIIDRLDKYSQPNRFDLVLITIAAFFGFVVWLVLAISTLLTGLSENDILMLVMGILGVYFAKLYYATGRIIQTAKAK